MVIVQWPEILVAILAGASAVLLAAAPMTTPFSLALFASLALLYFWRQRDWPSAGTRDDRLAVALVIFFGYCVLTSLWALDPAAAARKSATVAAIVLSAVLVARCLCLLSRRVLRMLVFSVLASLVFMALVIAIDLVRGLGILKYFYAAYPDLIPEALKGVELSGGEIVEAKPFLRNRSAAALGFMLWPALMISLGHASGGARRVSLVCVGAAIVSVIAASVNLSIQLALGLSVVAFVLCRLWPGVARRLIATAWCAAFLLVVPASYLAYEAGLHQAAWLPKRSAQARLYIWRYTAEQVLRNPVLGVGVRSTRAFAKTVPPADGNRYVKRPGWHAHNLYLQAWLELGALGVSILLGLGLLLLGRVERLEERLRPHGYATFVTVAGATAFGWGMWQSWLWGSVGFAVVALVLGGRYVTGTSQGA